MSRVQGKPNHTKNPTFLGLFWETKTAKEKLDLLLYRSACSLVCLYCFVSHAAKVSTDFRLTKYFSNFFQFIFHHRRVGPAVGAEMEQFPQPLKHSVLHAEAVGEAEFTRHIPAVDALLVEHA